MNLGEEIEMLRNHLTAKQKAFDAKSQLCESELAAGRTGLDAWTEADSLLREIRQLATTLKERIDTALKRLGG